MDDENRICAAVRKNPDGSWVSVTDVRMKMPLVQVLVRIAPGTTFRSGEFFLGMDIARRLDAVCLQAASGNHQQ